MAQSNNPAVSATGKEIDKEIQDTGNQISRLVSDLNTSFPSSVGSVRSGGSARGGSVTSSEVVDSFKDWFKDKYGLSWADADLAKNAQKAIFLDFMRYSRQHEEMAAAKAKDEDLEKALKQVKQEKVEDSEESASKPKSEPEIEIDPA